MSALLEVKGLKKYFPIHSGLFRRTTGYIKAVDEVNFSLDRGEILGIVGESGSGKSTTARLVIRLMEPTAGSIQFAAHPNEMQMVFQDPASSLNPRKNIQFAIGEGLLFHKKVRSEKEMIKKCAHLLERVGLSSECLERYPHQFSGGQQQRICIARSLALEPKLLICDEVVSALDVSVQAQILNLLLELQQEMHLAILFITHDLSVVQYLAHRILVMYQGKVVEEGETSALFSHPKHPYTRKLLVSRPIL